MATGELKTLTGRTSGWHFHNGIPPKVRWNLTAVRDLPSMTAYGIAGQHAFIVIAATDLIHALTTEDVRKLQSVARAPLNMGQLTVATVRVNDANDFECVGQQQGRPDGIPEHVWDELLAFMKRNDSRQQAKVDKELMRSVPQREEHALRVLPKLALVDLPPAPLDPAALTHKRARVFFDDIEIAHIESRRNVLMVSDERHRGVIAEYLLGHGYRPRPSLRDVGAPEIFAAVSFYGACDAFRIGVDLHDAAVVLRAHTQGWEPAQIGVYYPEQETLVPLAEQWVGPVTKVLGTHGLRVSAWSLEAPVGADARVLKYMTMRSRNVRVPRR